MRSPETLTPDFAACYAAQFRLIAGQLAVYLGNVEEAQEVTQEAFTRAWTRWGRIARYDDPAAWVRRVAWNLATSRLRRARTALRHWRSQRLELVAGPGPERVAIERALEALPVNQRRAVVLHYLAGLPVAEIAELCRAREGAVRTWLYRARLTLARHLTDEVTDDV
ncbi:SigE family RNA polymerase sigma factor [Dactylosporangium fulvum]|uniref:Sigma-70 family RNA polymerase sigma factor n=1 Tax=Dactylosporangium fulvum TaxID=53359 RepID=A0ABY5VN49_9ACTN|nr:sigma-70 family RNA polymerase sigma factor [Dactylosporangium fulvum]UWP79162.1 sigma-70 family RNA polymerase sigma factor [Dactylosporangium fulvum]